MKVTNAFIDVLFDIKEDGTYVQELRVTFSYLQSV